MAVEEALGPFMAPAEVRVTRTPLGGGATTVFTEEVADPDRKIAEVSLRLAQSLGYQQADVVVLDDAAQASSWASGDSVKVEVRRASSAAWTSAVDGFLGPSRTERADGRPVTTLVVHGWSALDDLVKLTADLSYQDTPWTDIADDLVTQVLGAGFARTITADAATPGSVAFAAGLKLREALDICRRALNSGADKWEHRIDMVAGVKTYLLYKRSAAVLRTFGRRHIMPGSHVQRGSVTEVVNKAVVTGATVPSFEDDHLEDADAGNIRLLTTVQRLAQPVDAPDTPIAVVTLTGNRSNATDPPTLNLGWARNAPNYDFLTFGTGRYNLMESSSAATTHWGRTRGAPYLDPDYVTDSHQNSFAAATTYEFVRVDLGANPPPVQGYCVDGTTTAAETILIDWSDDNAAWTNEVSVSGVTPPKMAYLGAAVTHRYWRLRIQHPGAFDGIGRDITSFNLITQKNVGADATNPHGLQGGAPDSGWVTYTTASSTGGSVVDELAKIDLEIDGLEHPIARVEVRHTESVASVSLNLYVQFSDVAAPASEADWEDLAILASTTSTVEDTIYVDRPAFKWLRVKTLDERAGGSAAITTTIQALRAYEHKSDEWWRPLASDSMRGATGSWDVTSLIRNPGTLQERTYSAPNVTVIPGARYWMLLWLQSAATAYSWWDLDYSCSMDLTSLTTFLGFEEGRGTTAYDSSPMGYTGTFGAAGGTASPGWCRGQVGGGHEFYPVEGATAGTYFDFQFQTGHNPGSTPFSMSKKINVMPGTIGTKQGIAGKGNGQVGVGGGSYSWFIDTDGKMLFAIWLTGGGVRKSAKSTTALVAGTDYTVGVKYDGANCTFYLNGVPDGVTAMTGTVQTVTSGAAHFFSVGRAMDTGAVASYLSAIGDEFYFFLRGLSDAEFLQLHNMTTTKRLMLSPDSGVTWYSAPADTLLRTYVAFNIHQLQGTAEDAASQAAYASLVPGGVLTGGAHDEALLTQAAVDAEAAALVNRRKSPPRRVQIVVPFDEGLLPGSMTRLEPEAAGLVGLAAVQTDVDVVEVSHRFGEQAVSVLACEEYPIQAGQPGDAALAYATRRTI